MTHDEHGPTPPASGSASNDAASTASAAGATTTKPARPSRRRHTTSRSRQPKEQKQAQEHNEQPVATEAPEAPTQPAATAAAQTAEVAPQEASAAAETPKRTQTRGRRGGSSRRRGKAESLDVQLVPVVSALETATTEPSAETTALEYPLEPALPATEPLPLDAAILAHLDALAEAGAQREQAEQSEFSPTGAVAPVETPPETSRYRFDRPRTQSSAPTSVRAERLSGWRATPPTLMTTPATAEATLTDEATNAATEPAVDAEIVGPAESAVDTGEKAAETPESAEPQAGEESSVILAGPATDEAQAEVSEAEDTSEHEGAGRRRRRGRGRGRSGRAHDAETAEAEGDEQQEPTSPRLPAPYTAPETAVTYARDYDQSNGNRRAEAIDRAVESYEDPSYGYGPYTPAPSAPSAPRTRNTRANLPATRQQGQQESQDAHWSMADAQQQVQEPSSPFGAPEPSFARGFGPQSAGVAAPLHETPTRVRRGERGGEAPPMSANQLGNVITNAITQQTDRLLSELRRQQYPPSMTLALPAFPSTDRIGVFVDVANLLYSARNQRMNIDFGRLLDFLRGNRRLIRAHAYAPTNPDPHAEQTFLAAVKGVGYRITTKNYKTFASGARKADMDLDLCMDIVRMVDAGALDTVLLVSGDSDFLPLLEYCSDHGVRVEVAAFEDAAAMILRQSCDLFINLSQVDEIRA